LALTTSGTACSCSRSYPTPIASDHKGSTGKGCRRNSLAERLAMTYGTPGRTVYPHPEFVEHAMGFPVGWSEL
jgi:hypothetical protein